METVVHNCWGERYEKLLATIVRKSR
jgi:hypothetical protein